MNNSLSWQASPRYPDIRVRSITAEFDQYKLPLAKVEQLATGFRWCEGPVWFGDSRTLLWSDVPGDCIYRWDEQTGLTTEFRKPSGNANGNTRDRQGRLLSCQHLYRSITRTEYDGSITTLASHHDGRRLNSPNDIVCKSDGSIWFTDPSFGILGFYEGFKADSEIPTNVYRLDVDGTLNTVATGINQPNGLAFSPDESILYVIASRRQPRAILAFDVLDGRTLENERVFAEAEPEGTPDGFRVDIHGNLWCGWGMGSDALDGVHVFNASGSLIGRIDLPERCANLCFGGLHRNRLFMAASTSVYSLYVNTQGLPT